MRRLFVSPEQIDRDMIHVLGDDVKHIKDVLRMKVGDEVIATCGRGIDYVCGIFVIEEEEIILHIQKEVPDVSELPVKLTLFQALPKGDKMELIIQKAVELGVTEIVPVRTKRCVVKLAGEKAQKKVSRWQKIAEEAAKQSGRGVVPDVRDITDFDDAIRKAERCGHIFIPYELCEDAVSVQSIKDVICSGVKSIGVFIGAEGGFETGEVDQVVNAGGEMISLGQRILRTETAAIAVMSVLMMMIEDGA